MAAILEERGLDPAAVQANLERAAASCGVPFGKRTHTYNSRRANELGKWAELKGKRDAFDAAVFRAFFVERKNIALEEVLREIAAEAGLDPEEAADVLKKGTFRDAVLQDWDYSARCGIVAAPTYRMGTHRLVGAHPYERLAAFVEKAGCRKRSP
jgi:predicted DsbA family dithiol-disulfide isomerase